MSVLYELANMVLPTASFVDNTELFVNKEESQCYINSAMRDCNVYKFNTWMNMFAPKKHYYYCDLGDIYLRLEASGHYILQVTGSNRNAAFNRIDNIILNLECDGNTKIKIPNAEKYEGIFYTIIEDKNNPITLKSGAWCTDRIPQRDNKLAIVSCTFKREDYINKNIALFEDFIKANPVLSDKIKLIVVDNGKTLDVNRSNERVKIIPNMNAGGAGGFTRGLIDVMEQDAGFTRVLFMDDDVEIFPESFYRTLLLSNYLKEEFKDAFINGAMMDLYDKSKFFENLSVQHYLWLTGYYNNIDVTEYSNILLTNDISVSTFGDINRYVSSAWWYCSFPLEFACEKGLPMPIFFRGDDAEWSWRACGKHIISMNGICIWHASFEWRVSKVADYYYLPRNMFFLNVIYTPHFRNKYESMFMSRLNYLLSTYDYVSLEIFKTALEDILQGAEIFKERPDIQFSNINNISKSIVYLPCDNMCELENVKSHRIHAKKWRKFIWRITKNGRYAPKFLLKKYGVALEWYPPKEDFILVKEVKVYNLFTNKYEIRKFDRKKLNYYEKEIKRLIRKIDKNYDSLHEDYLNAHKEFSTMQFWKKYLDLSCTNMTKNPEYEMVN